MTKKELQDVCDRDCKQKRTEKIVDIVYTIVKIAVGVLIGKGVI